MKNISILFLKSVLIIIGVVILIALIWFPLTEGRAQNLDLFKIYSDPLILFVYVVSISFFIAIFHAFKILGFVEKNIFFTQNTKNSLRIIKLCAIILAISIFLVAVFILIFHDKNDDPAGFIVLCIFSIVVTIIIASLTAIFENLLQSMIEKINQAK